MYYHLEPDVAGGFGELTEVDPKTRPPTVRRLHYEFEGWRGDCLLTSFPVYILSEPAARDLVGQGFNGFELDEVIISRSDVFDQLQPGVQLPRFVWLKVTGVAGIDDLGVLDNADLVVSFDVLSVLHKHGLENCETTRYYPGQR